MPLQTTQSRSREKHIAADGKPVSAHPYKAANCEEWRASPPFLSLFFLRDAEEWRIDFTQFRVK
jgi:hypothetical protein